MISGAHIIVYSKNADADREFFRDVLELKSVDSGRGWLIFALPPTEAAVHPGEKNNQHELFLICDDIEAATERLESHKVKCTPISEERWGRLTRITLPGGGNVGLYQPKHPTAFGRK